MGSLKVLRSSPVKSKKKHVVFSPILLLLLLTLFSCRLKTDSVSHAQPVMFPGNEVTGTELPAGFQEALVASGLKEPSVMAFTPDGRLLIGERIVGKIRVLLPDGTLLPEPMITLNIPKGEDGVPTRHNSSGVIGFTFDPDFMTEPYIYIFYMQHHPRHNRVSRFLIDSENPNRLIEESEEVLIELPFNDVGSSGSHNGGGIIFGEDGKLYIATGDGWEAHGVWEKGEPVQSLETLTGKILRINKDGTIPPDNPFYDQTTGDFRSIYALGLRNPTTLTKHPEKKNIYINDPNMTSGYTNKDEVYELEEGANYQWQWQPGSPGTRHNPVVRAGKSVIVGGAWYPDEGPFPSDYFGNYFIALWGANAPQPGSIVRMISDQENQIEPFHPSAGDGMHGMGKPVTISIGPEGNLYWLASTYETENGSVFKISYSEEFTGERLSPPGIVPNGGSFPFHVDVQLVHSGGEHLHYTLDGSEPNINSPQYTAPFLLEESAVIKARVFKEGSLPGRISTAVFEIYEDKKPPKVVKAFVDKPNNLRVQFDEAIDQVSAETISNYQISSGIQIQTVALEYDNKSVILTTSDFSAEKNYSLSVQNIFDRAEPSNKMSEKSKIKISFVARDGSYGIDGRQYTARFLKLPKAVDGNFPLLLSQTGIFDDVFTLTPAPGVIPYIINTAQWNNGTFMQRWIALPYLSDSDGHKNQIEFDMYEPWLFPAGTVIIRHVEIIVNERMSTRKRLETQLLVAESTGSFYGVTYKWREDGRDADLVTSSLTENLSILRKTNEISNLEYRIDSRSCMACHTPQAGYVLGVNTRQLNRNYFYPQTGVEDNQLRTWNAINMFNQDIGEEDIPFFPKMAALNDVESTVENRIRSYFDVNCGNCHRPDGAMTNIDLRFKTDLHNQGLILGNAYNIFGIEGSKAIVPGDPDRSIVYQRVNTSIQGIQMPQFSSRIDEEFVKLLKEWIGNLDQQEFENQY